MPASWIKNNYEARVWEKSKDLAAEKVGKLDHPLKWRYAHGIFNKLMVNNKLEEDVIELSEEDGLINSEHEDNIFKEIKTYLENHPVFSTVSEEELYEAIEEVFSGYMIESENEQLDKSMLYEFVNQYMLSGSVGGSGSNIGIMGGYKDEKTKGPYVFGVPGTDQGVGSLNTGVHKGEQHNAKVVIPDKVSNYKPWEHQIDVHGNIKSDVERSQKNSEFESSWDGPVGDLFRYLEDAGHTIEELNSLTDEEFEDMLIKEIKKDVKIKQLNDIKASGDNTQKINEIFGYDTQILQEEKGGAAEQARQILASKYNQKDVSLKQGRTFVVDRFDVYKRMNKRGWFWKSKDKQWVRKPPKFNVDSKPKTKESESSDKETSKQSTSDKNDKKESSVEPDNKVGSDESDLDDEILNPFENSTFVEKIKDYTGRFILALGHEDKLSTEFKFNDEKETWEPTIPKDQIYSKIEMMKYNWNPNKYVWLNDSMSLPQPIYDAEENVKTVVARAFSAAKNNVPKKIEVVNGTPTVNKNDVVEQMTNNNFEFDEEQNKWLWKEPVTETVINESVDVITEKASAIEDEPPRGYSIDNAQEMQARMLYKLVLIGKLHKHRGDLNKIKKTGFVIGEPTNIGGDKSRDEVHEFYSTVYEIYKGYGVGISEEEYKKLFQAKIDINVIYNSLEKEGYSFSEDDNLPMWRQGKDLPKIMKYIGEDEKSFTGRGVLAAIVGGNKASQYINIEFDKNITPIISADKIVANLQSVNRNYDWYEYKNDSGQNVVRGWTKISEQDRTTKNEIIGSDVRRKKMQDERFMQRMKTKPYYNMNSQEKEKYKELVGRQRIAEFHGIDLRDWPYSDSPEDKAERKKLTNKFNRHYRFEFNPESGTADWVRRKEADVHPAFRNIENRLLKPGGTGQKILNRLKTYATGAGALGLGLGKILQTISKIHV